MKGGDIIVGINGHRIDDLAGYAQILRKLTPGDIITLSFTREGQEQNVELTVAER